MFTKLMRLGRDAELRDTASGAVCNLTLAYDYGKKVDGKRPTQWVDAALWGKRAESLAQYLKKGQAVVVSLDDVHVKTYDKKDGTQGVTLAGNVAGIEFAGKPPESKPVEKPAAKSAPTEAPFEDDDIPF